MKTALLILLISIGLVSFQFSFYYKCEFNLKLNADWEEKLTDKSFPFEFIEKISNISKYDTLKMSKEELSHQEIKTNFFMFKSTNKDSTKIQLSEHIFRTTCAAYEEFKDAFFYYHTSWPGYEKLTVPCVYIIQNNKIFVIQVPPGQEELMEEFMNSFLKILLIESFDSDSVFIRKTSGKSELKRR